MSQRRYTPDERAAAIAAMQLGEPAYALSARIGIPVSTLLGWKHQRRGTRAIVREQKGEELGELVTEYIRESLWTLRIQARQFADGAWLQRQNAADVAILHGVLADKTIRVLAALRPASGDDALEHP